MLDISDLKKIPILAHLDDSGLHALAGIAEEREFVEGEIIFSEGTDQGSLYIVISGEVRITKATYSGEQKPIATLGPGTFFGEMALFDDFVRSATATAANPVRALEITKEAFMKFLSSDAAGASKLMLQIMRRVAPRIRQTNRELVALYEAGRIIGERTELGDILYNLLAVLSAAVSCARGAAFMINPSAGVLECRAAFGYDDDPSGWTEPLTGGIAEQVIQAENPIIIQNFQQDPRFENVPPVGYETESMLVGAVRAQGEPTGMIVLCDKTDRAGGPAQFNSGDSNLLAAVAAQAAGAIESVRLHEEAQEKEKLDRVYFRF